MRVSKRTYAVLSHLTLLLWVMPAGASVAVFEGDSITAQTYLPTNQRWVTITTTNLGGQITTAVNAAADFSKIGDVMARAAAVDAQRRTGPNVLVLLVGINNLFAGTPPTDLVASIKSYCLARRVAGWKILLLTILPAKSGGIIALRNATNDLIRADPSFYDGLADIALDPVIGCDTCALDPTYYNWSDQAHPTAAGTARIPPIIAPVLSALLGSSCTVANPNCLKRLQEQSPSTER
jgi:lysophospholipase L1-like esterase